MAKPLAPAHADRLAAEARAEVFQLLDLQLAPLGLAAMEALSPRAGEVILDVGCGAGDTVLQLAERVGPGGQVIGVDIAPSLASLARRRARALRQARVIEADASALALPDGSVDGVFSRFGVMAFDNPVRAFSNFRRMLTPEGRLAFVCWRALEDNELDLLPLRAAGLEARIDRTPFSFDAAETIRSVLEAAGFRQITLKARDESVTSGDLDAMASVVLKVGPLGKILRENPELRAAAEPRVRAALMARREPGGVRLRAATWIVAAAL